MNTENNRFDPHEELNDFKRRDIHRAVPLLLTGCFILFLLLWATFSRGCITEKPVEKELTGELGSGDKARDGGHTHGDGPGAGNAGQGPGAGQQGEQKGKKDQAQAPSGTGKDSSKPDSSTTEQSKDDSQAPAGSSEEAVQPPQSPPTQSTPPQPTPPPPPQPQRPTAVIRTDTPPAPGSNKKSGGTATGREGFYGVEIKATGKVIFIIDTSSSMGSLSTEIMGKTRLDVLKMELKKAVFGAQEPTRDTYQKSGGVIIIPFNSTTSRHPNEKLFRYRKEADMKKLNELIDSLEPCGGTNMKPAWLMALQAAKKENINAIFFLTDGHPNDGFDAEWLLPQLKTPRFKKITVHTIVIGQDVPFMKKISSECKGKHIYIP